MKTVKTYLLLKENFNFSPMSLLHKYVRTPESQIGYVEDVHKALTSDKVLCVVRMFGDSFKLEFWEDELVEIAIEKYLPTIGTDDIDYSKREVFQLGDSKSDSWIVPGNPNEKRGSG